MSNWYIFDNQITELLGFDILWLPAVAYKFVTPHLSRGGMGYKNVSLEAGPYVGALPLSNGDTLYIIPREGRESYSRMLFVVEGLEDAIHQEFQQLVNLGYEESGNTPWNVLLARPFVNRLRLIEKESLTTERRPVYQRLGYIKGRVKISKSLINLARSEEHPIYSHLRERTMLTLENRLLSTASAILLNTKTVNANQHQIALRWAKLGKGRFVNSHDLQQVSAGLKSHRYTGSRSYYVTALVMARLIISQAGLTLNDLESIEGEPLITNMADLFERYIRTVISKSLSPRGYLVEKKQNHSTTLFLDGTCELKPDVIISQFATVKLVVDVKYKPRLTISPSDYYQMNTYLENFGVDTGLLVFPNTGQSEFSLTKRETLQNRRIYELRLPLSDWNKSEQALVDVISSFL